MTDTTTDLAGLGDYVETTRFGHRGRVTKVHYRCPEDDDWFDRQQGLSPEDKDRRWVSILVTNNAGAVVVPDWDAKVVDPFDFVNTAASHYWPSEYAK